MGWARPLAILLALGLLFGLLVWYGATDPDANPEYDSEPWNEPADWEFAYMYAVSVLAVAWVGWRARRQWRIDPTRLVLTPRRPTDGNSSADDPERAEDGGV